MVGTAAKKLAEAKTKAPADKQPFNPELFKEIITLADPVYKSILEKHPESMFYFEYDYYLSETLSGTTSLAEFVFRYLGDVERT